MMENRRLRSSQGYRTALTSFTDPKDTIMRYVKTEDEKEEEVSVKMEEEEIPLQRSRDARVKDEEKDVYVKMNGVEVPVQAAIPWASLSSMYPDSREVKDEETREVFVNFKEEGNPFHFNTDYHGQSFLQEEVKHSSAPSSPSQEPLPRRRRVLRELDTSDSDFNPVSSSGSPAASPDLPPAPASRLRGKLRQRFSYDENMVLMQELKVHWEKLYGPLRKRTPLGQRSDIWHGVARKVSASSGIWRSVDICKKRLCDIRRHAHKKNSAQRGHSNGGPARDRELQEFHYMYLSLLRPEAPRGCVYGQGAGSHANHTHPPASAPPPIAAQRLAANPDVSHATQPRAAPPSSREGSSPAPVQAAKVDKGTGLLHLQEVSGEAPQTPVARSPAAPRPPEPSLDILDTSHSEAGRMEASSGVFQDAALVILRHQQRALEEISSGVRQQTLLLQQLVAGVQLLISSPCCGRGRGRGRASGGADRERHGHQH